MTVTIQGNLAGTGTGSIAGGQITASVYYHGFKVYSARGDICATTSCPMQPGAVTVSNHWPLPSLAPPGPYTIQMEGLAPSTQIVRLSTKTRNPLLQGELQGNMQQLFCVKVSFSM
eukprot:CAMPEP_0202894620 /NCGR_PEP_ID=MMETSP1392-20130828/3990_1 /ASSEMBLY_ACC=CAM_ASM_000868 /TAXON_ID=225041 /ORGANISM="Chlamydomonas chlamydogama, Strain SAG 11-48b" /LENGTH=115 /DNA_ID=CAMNT_0049579371 /DNA_START=297 /DNA_END=644 /DNA_ORIENTATION=+